VKDYVPDGLSDFAEALANPIKYQSELEKRAQQLAVLTDDMDVIEVKTDSYNQFQKLLANFLCCTVLACFHNDSRYDMSFVYLCSKLLPFMQMDSYKGDFIKFYSCSVLFVMCSSVSRPVVRVHRKNNIGNGENTKKKELK
jgi:hypothetical protein